MAINFSASFAACLAAGLKVPRQFMYCIAQDTGAPYVVYKDQGGPGGGGGEWGGGGGGGGGGGSAVGPPPSGGGAGGGGNGSSGGAPSAGSGGNTGPGIPPPPSGAANGPTNGAAGGGAGAGGGGGPPPPPPPPNANGPGGGSGPPAPSEHFPSSPQDSQHPSAPPLQPQQQPPPQQPPQQQSSPSPSYPQQHTPTSSLPDETPTADPQESSSPQESDMPCDMGPNYYPGPPRHAVLSPTTFMSYLKQPVMLTTLNPADQPAEFHSVFGSGMTELLSNGGLKSSQMGQGGHLIPGGHGGHGHGHGGGSQSSHQGSKNCDLRLFKCLTCGKDFKQKSTLLQHERIHTDSRPYGCTECGKRFRQQSHLTQHLRIHANEKPFACVYCERTFRQRAILNQHLRIHSDVSPHLVYKNGQLWPQDVPFPQQDNKEALLSLAQQHQPFDASQQDHCFPDGTVNQFPAYFKDAKGNTHGVLGPNGKGIPELIQSGRQAGMPLYVRCPICQKEFKQKSTLLQHGCIHIESRPYPCAECGKRFRQQSHLTQHLRIHTNEKPYGCLYCGRNFRQRTILNQHVRIHTGEKPYKCSQCGKDFRQKAILDQHTRTHQGDRPYCCPMANCRRRFPSEPELKRHVDNHMNPHHGGAGKRRPLGQPPQPVVKPELYLPQCYTPAAAAAAAFQQQYTMSQLLQPPPQNLNGRDEKNQRVFSMYDPQLLKERIARYPPHPSPQPPPPPPTSEATSSSVKENYSKNTCDWT